MSHREKHPEPKTEEEKKRFKYRHNYPYRRQPKPGDYGVKRSTTTEKYVPVTTESVRYHEQFGFYPVTTEQPRYQENFGFHPVDQPNHPDEFGYHPVTTQRSRYIEDVVHNPKQTESPPNIAGPFVTVQKESSGDLGLNREGSRFQSRMGQVFQTESENNTDLARQPKQTDDMFVDYGSDSSLNEVRVLPPEEFRHLLAQVDGIDRKVNSHRTIHT